MLPSWPLQREMRSVSHPEKESFNECLVRCYRQAEPARRLINLQQVPTLILQAEASYHAGYDHCSVRFLKQAGVNVDFIKLEEVGVRGNGHMMMLEKNNQEIARVMIDWLQKSVR